MSGSEGLVTQVVNLRQTRKRKLKAEKDRQAAENRAKFGRTKAEKDLAKKQQHKLNQDHEGRKLDK